MTWKLHDLAAAIGAALEGDGSAEISGVASLAHAGPADLSFFGNPRYRPQLDATQAGAVVVPTDLKVERAGLNLLRVESVDKAFTLAVGLLLPSPPPPAAGLHPTAVVGRNAALGRGVALGPHAVLGDGVSIGDGTRVGAGCFLGDGVRLGAGCILYPNVTVREGVIVGDRTILHSGCVIGSDGYGYYFEDGRHHKIPQVGTVEIGSDVEIGSCTTVDRARFGATRIGDGTKIDNLVMVAHNVTIGRHTLIVGCVGIPGSVEIGDYCVVGGQAGFVGHVKVGNNVKIAARTGVSRDIESNEAVAGYPPQPYEEWLRDRIRERQVFQMPRKVKELEQRLEALERSMHPPA